MGGDDQTRNLIMAAVLSMMVVFGWYALFPPAPPPEQPPATAEGAPGAPAPEGGAATATAPAAPVTRAEAITGTRIPVETPSVSGSIRLEGGRLDDLHLTKYKVSQKPGSDTVILLNPATTSDPYYIDHGWQRTEGAAEIPLPKADTPWTIESGEKLTPETPVTLVWDNGAGLIFRRKIAVDDQYMFTVTQTVENTTDAEIKLAPFGKVSRYEGQASTRLWILHEGAVAVADDELKEIDYDDLKELAPDPQTGARFEYLQVTANGWLGFTDKYWMTSLVAKPGSPFDGYYQVRQRGPIPQFQAQMRQPVQTVAPGASVSVESYFFAGAKEFYTLRGYEEKLGIIDFVNAIDWGWFYFLTKPIFQLLAFVKSFIGNMGFSIITLTLIIKAILFPLAYKSYVSMSKMKKLQPEMQKIKERVGDDRQKMQQEMMALYKKEKVNPASGCLPILLQIPIFFSLYKVLFVTIEMRHEPFIAWIKDLSAPDPTSVLNLFGLLPWGVPDPESFFAIFSIGVFPILMGITMWLQQKLNPAPTDPTQAMIFAWMPWVFMFMLGQFASGLVIYWVANNTITFIQQYAIMRSQGVKVDLLGNITSSFKKGKTEVMSWSLAHIFRHPVKSLGEEELKSVDLNKGKPMPFDRRWAVAHGDAPGITGWAGSKNFVTQTHVPKLAQIGVSFRKEHHILHLTHPDLPDLAIQPGTPDGDDALSEWLDPLVAGTTRSGPFLVYTIPDVAFTDFEDTHISIGSEASRRALGELAGRDLEHIRFRMNLWLEGLAPWAELDLVGREIAVGDDVRLKVIERIKRCNATAASPATGARDVPVPELLHQHLGHMDFGVYAQVVKGGTIRQGDAARAL